MSGEKEYVWLPSNQKQFTTQTFPISCKTLFVDKHTLNKFWLQYLQILDKKKVLGRVFKWENGTHARAIPLITLTTDGYRKCFANQAVKLLQ